MRHAEELLIEREEVRVSPLHHPLQAGFHVFHAQYVHYRLAVTGVHDAHAQGGTQSLGLQDIVL
eukprot:CAMPEP_0173185186 /NCGR_PEP_ID=MMETSP1141-20130122/9403_1 /TAXON_ID=483371 /ORGANISM="non described non described, Strain CCMP2298" /LENGTH=63 /DNA_ID=CAMNT_0014108663 /DNA_START=854 /DNA_END=1045 /DNA_ORIENTATION=-